MVLVNCKILVGTNTHSFLSLFWQLGSVGSFYVFWGIQDGLSAYDLFGTMPKLFDFINQYFALFFFTTSYILVEFGLKILDD